MEGVSQTIAIRWFLHLILPFYIHSQIPFVSYHSSHIFIYPQELKDSLTKQQDIIYMFFLGGTGTPAWLRYDFWYYLCHCRLGSKNYEWTFRCCGPATWFDRGWTGPTESCWCFTPRKKGNIYRYVYTNEIIHIPCCGCWSHVLEFICK